MVICMVWIFGFGIYLIDINDVYNFEVGVIIFIDVEFWNMRCFVDNGRVVSFKDEFYFFFVYYFDIVFFVNLVKVIRLDNEDGFN